MQPARWCGRGRCRKATHHCPAAPRDDHLHAPEPHHARRTALGIACGAGAALFWAAGFVAARHGLTVGFAPEDLALHRFAWAGLALLPFAARDGFADLGAVGAWRALLLTLLGGPPLAALSYVGFLFVPLGHGGVIQPACAALGGILLATVVLKEKLPASRVAGALMMVGGLVVFGAEALTTIGPHGIIGDLTFVLAGLSWAVFGMLLKLWRLQPTRAVVIVSLISILDLPFHGLVFGFDRMMAAGLWENLLQAAIQGVLAGGGAIYCYARAVDLIGAGRAAVFPTLVPGFTLLIGYVAIGNVPTLMQLAGLAIVALGFRYAMKG